MQFEKIHLFTEEKSPSRKKTKTNSRFCCVVSCNSDDETLTYHQFPKAGNKVVFENQNGERIICDVRKIWEDRVGVDQKITKYSKVCSLHFRDEDYGSKSKGRHKRLKSGAVPSLNLPEESAFITFKDRLKPLCQKVISDRNRLRENTSAINKKIHNASSKAESMIKLNTQNNNQKRDSQTYTSVQTKETDSIIIIDSSFEYSKEHDIHIYEENNNLVKNDELPKNSDLQVVETKYELEEKIEIGRIELIETKVPNTTKTEVAILHCESPSCDKQNPGVEDAKTQIMDILLMCTSFEIENIEKKRLLQYYYLSL